MKILVKVTKEILKKSMFCQQPGTVDKDGNMFPTSLSCAFSLAFRDLFPDASVGYHTIFPFLIACPTGETYPPELIINNTDEMHEFIVMFDRLAPYPDKRLAIPEQTFEVHIPDSVIERIGITQVNEILSNSSNLERV